MILIADVDIDLLRELNQFGAVRNLRDCRKDIFDLKRTKKRMTDTETLSLKILVFLPHH